MRQEYLATIDKRSEDEVKNLLSHLLPETGTYQRNVDFLKYLIDSNKIEEFYMEMKGSGHGLKELGKGFFIVNLLEYQ